MAVKVPEVHWFEGMFLRPQHLQLFSRHLNALVADAGTMGHPYPWGLADIQIATEQLEAFTFALDRCDVVFPDGTRGSMPTTLRVNPRDCRAAVDQSDGEVTVHLGVRLLAEGEANTRAEDELEKATSAEGSRYIQGTVELSDENLGGPAHPVQTRALNGRLFFGDEDREGYATVPIAMIRRAGYGRSAPELAREFIPPLVNAWAWPTLTQLVHGVAKRVEAKLRFLQAEVSDGRLSLDTVGIGAWQALFKLQIVGSFMHVLRQIVSLPSAHPFPVYLELTRLAGELSIFEERGAEGVNVPLYDHDRLGECFHAVVYTVEQLLEKILSGQFIRVDFSVENELLVAGLQAEWLSGASEIYLCAETDMTDRQLLTRLETVKIGAPDDIQLLIARRLFGLDLELLRRTPGGLPSRGNLHYFSIARDGIYWQEVERRSSLAISGGIDPKLRFCLYIIRKPERRVEGV